MDNAKKRTIQSISVKAAIIQSKYNAKVLKVVNNSIFLKAEKPDIMEDYDCAFISPKEAITTILFEILNPKQAIS